MLDTELQKEITARKLRQLRKVKGWSQQQIANRLRITKSRYKSYEHARNTMPYRIIAALCAAYQIALDDFEKLKISDTVHTL